MSTPNFLQIKPNGLNLPSNSSTVVASAGDLAYNSSSNKFAVWATAADFVVQEANTATLTNKTIDASSNTVSNLTNANLSGSAAITNANLAQMSAATVKANIGGSSATPSDVALGTTTEATSSVLTLSGWTNATIGSPTIQVKQSSASQSGYLSSTDWSTFNAKQTAGNYITALTGDVTASGPGSAAASLTATTNNTITTLSALTAASSLASVGTITSGTWNATTIAIAHGGTGQTSASAAFNALSPITTTGDMIYSASGATNSRLPIGSANQVLATIGGIPTWSNLSQLPIPQGNKNYLSGVTTSNGANNGNGNWELGSTTGWSLAHSALSGVLPTSTATAGSAFSSSSGGSAASVNLSLSVVSSGQLSGSYSGSLASSASSVAGDLLISNAFNIDTEDQAKVMTVKAYYSVNSGAANLNFSGTSSNSFAVWIYDVTNGAWIMPAGVYNLVQNSGAGYVTATFQTTSNSTQYQLALININASSGAYTLYLDDLFVGPQTAPMAPNLGDWNTNYTVTPSAGFGAVTNLKTFSRRVGDSLQVHMTFDCGTYAGSTLSVALPSGLSADSTKLSSIQSNLGLGFASSNATNNIWSGSGNGLMVFYDGSDTANLYVTTSGGSSGLNKANGTGLGANNAPVMLEFTVPITGWSSNSVQSSDTDTRVVTFIAAGTPTFAGSNTNFIFPSGAVINDTHAGYNASTGFYTVPVSGYYKIYGYLEQSSAAGARIFLTKNGSQQYAIGILPTNSNSGNIYSGEIKANAGDTLSIQSGTTTFVLNASTMNIERISGPAVIAATESVNAKYFASANGNTDAVTPVNYDTKIYDSHGSVTTGSNWKFTAPVSGKYSIKTFWNNASTVGNTQMILYKNGSLLEMISFLTSTQEANTGTTTIALNSGDYVDIRANNSTYPWAGGSYPGIICVIEIERVGN